MSSLVKITNDKHVKKSEILAVDRSHLEDYKTVIKMKHQVEVHISILLPSEVIAILDSDTVRPLK